MKRIFTYHITNDTPGETIFSYLKKKGYSRHILTQLKKTKNGICLNDRRVYVSESLSSGDILCVTLLEEDFSEKILPVKMDLNMIYEDEDLLIIDKAPDTPIHPSINNYDNTLANGIAYYFAQKGETFTYRCINRLDRDTSGLLIIAKHMLSAAILSKMVTQRKIHREYLAIASGEVPPNGTINAPIARKEGSAIERTVDFQKGEQALTHFCRKEYQNGYSLVSLKLETGRTHQIRVHMQYIGHPLIGDYLYHPDCRLICRQALHSSRLSFSHPITGKNMDIYSPLPQDMKAVFKNIESLL